MKDYINTVEWLFYRWVLFLMLHYKNTKIKTTKKKNDKEFATLISCIFLFYFVLGALLQNAYR